MAPRDQLISCPPMAAGPQWMNMPKRPSRHHLRSGGATLGAVGSAADSGSATARRAKVARKRKAEERNMSMDKPARADSKIKRRAGAVMWHEMATDGQPCARRCSRCTARVRLRSFRAWRAGWSAVPGYGGGTCPTCPERRSRFMRGASASPCPQPGDLARSSRARANLRGPSASVA